MILISIIRVFRISIFENEIKRQGLNLLGWRDVPTNSKVVGEIASKSQPKIKQVFISKNEKLRRINQNY